MTVLQSRVWFFDLDNTLHDARHAAFAPIDAAMTAYITRYLQVPHFEANALRQHYWQRYGATVKGLVRHHGVNAQHFLRETHLLPGLEERLVFNSAQLLSVAKLPGRKWIYTNGPTHYARRIIKATGVSHVFEGIWGMEQTLMLGDYRPKPDIRALRHMLSKLGASPEHCVLVDDTPQNLNNAKRLHMKTVWMNGYCEHAHKMLIRRQLRNVDATVGRLMDIHVHVARL